MTYEEAKDQLALEKHNTTYRAFYLTAGFPYIIKLNDEAAELYARSKWDEACEAMEKEATISFGGCNYEGEKEPFISFGKPEFKP